MTIKKVYSQKGEWVGDIEQSVYYTQRDFKQNQVFKYIYGNPIAIDNYVIKQLLMNNINFIAILVSGFNNRSFWCVSSVHFFLSNSEEINYKNHGKQRRMDMELWKKADDLEGINKVIGLYNRELEGVFF